MAPFLKRMSLILTTSAKFALFCWASSRFCVRKSAIASSTVRLRVSAPGGGWGAGSAPKDAPHSSPVAIATQPSQARSLVLLVLEKPIIRLLENDSRQQISWSRAAESDSSHPTFTYREDQMRYVENR